MDELRAHASCPPHVATVIPTTSTPRARDGARSVATHLRMRLIQSLTIAALLCARAGVAHCAWTVDADGACVRKWAPSDMLRGPQAIVYAPLQPVRTTVAGAEYAWNKTEWRWWYTVVLGSAVTGVSAAAGLVEGLWWVCGRGRHADGRLFRAHTRAGVGPQRATPAVYRHYGLNTCTHRGPLRPDPHRRQVTYNG